MPVHNGEAYVRQALDSLLGQSHTNLELSISDNASTDATEEICRDFASRDSRVRYRRNAANIGMARNFNRAFQPATGEYFFWAAHDDLWEADFVSRCVDALGDCPSAVLCYPQGQYIGPDGELIDFAFPSFNTAGSGPSGMDRISRVHTHMWGITYPFPIKGLIRTDALRRTRLVRDLFMTELGLVIELSLLGEFAYLPEVLFYNRVATSGDWYERFDAQVEKIDRPVAGRLSVARSCAEMLIGNVQAVTRHVPGYRGRAILVPSIVFCTLVKYRWLIAGLIELNRRKRHR